MRIFHLFLALLIVVIWGFNFVVIKHALTEIPPLSLCCIRFFLATIPAIFFVKRPNLPLKLLVAYGMTMFALQFTLLFAGIYVGMPSGLASLLLHVHVFFTILLAIIFLGETAYFSQILGAVVSFLGILLIGYHADGTIPFWGFVLIITAAFSWGVGNIVSKKIGNTNMLALVIWGNFIALPPLLIITLLTEGPYHFVHVFQNMNWLMAGTIIYLAYPTTIFGFAIWSWLLHHYNVATITPFSLLIPIVSLASTSLVLGEPLQDWKIYASLLVILGLCINVFGPVLFDKYKLRREYV